jgi:hypothetical protein
VAAIGPVAAAACADIFASAFQGATVRLCARVYLNGADVRRDALASICYTVYRLPADGEQARIALEGWQARVVSPADVIFDVLQSDQAASAYNFCHTPPIGESSPFALAGRVYQVEYTLRPVSGEPGVVRFVVRVA